MPVARWTPAFGCMQRSGCRGTAVVLGQHPAAGRLMNSSIISCCYWPALKCLPMKNPPGEKYVFPLLKYRRPYKKSTHYRNVPIKVSPADNLAVKIRPAQAAAGRGGFLPVNCGPGGDFSGRDDLIMGHRRIATATAIRWTICHRATWDSVTWRQSPAHSRVLLCAPPWSTWDARLHVSAGWAKMYA